MKILHTGDWHLGDKLYGWDRSDEEEAFFAQLKDVVARERPDAMVVSGDIFDTGVPGNDVAKKFTDQLLDVVSACPTMETVVIAGNHDSYSRLVVDEALWKRCRVHMFGIPSEDGEGRARFAENVVEVGDKGVIAAVPFCHERNFPRVEGAPGESRMKEYFAALADHVAERANGRPRVLVAHLAVGRQTMFRGQDRTMVVGGQECVDPETLGGGYDYIALGHIHHPQWAGGAGTVAYYCGTPRAINFDEDCRHGVDIVQVESGRKPEVTLVELAPKRALETIGKEAPLAFSEALNRLAAAAFPAETYIRLNVALGATEAVGPDWTERARQACAAKGYRYCVINAIREELAEEGEQAGRSGLTINELRELSDDEVVEILSARRALTPRQCELVKSLMEGLDA